MSVDGKGAINLKMGERKGPRATRQIGILVVQRAHCPLYSIVSRWMGSISAVFYRENKEIIGLGL